MKIKVLFINIILFIVAGITLKLYTEPYKYQPVDDAGVVRSKTETVILPEKFLREYDPITIFFTEAKPVKAGPEDHPEKYIDMNIDQPGEFRWVDDKTLQFKPASAWSPLKKYYIKAGGSVRELSTFLNPPVQVRSLPGEGDYIREFSIAFDQAMDVQDLLKVLSIEVLDAPGYEGANGIWFSKSDYEIKLMESRSANRQSSFLVVLKKPVGPGKKAKVHFQLTTGDTAAASSAVYEFSTRPEFNVSAFGTSRDALPVSRDGSKYPKQQYLRGQDNLQITVHFSESISNMSYSQVRDFITITPAVDNMGSYVSGNSLYITADFKREKLYEISIRQAPVWSSSGRPLKLSGESRFYAVFPSRQAVMQWRKSDGIMEQYGPKQIPMHGRGMDKIDVRLYRIAPLSRKLWPFPDSPVPLQENTMPPGPGEEPDNSSEDNEYTGTREIQQHLLMMGSPLLSRVVELPIQKEGNMADFGLDIEPLLKDIKLDDKPGTYVAGFRKLDGSKERYYVRFQITDLCLSIIEERNGLRFVVTSYKTGLPVSGAKVRFEGYDSGKTKKRSWTVLKEGITDADGFLFIGKERNQENYKRFVVSKGDDLLVLSPDKAVSTFRNNYWSENTENWLALLKGEDTTYSPSYKGFIFPERPVYKPEEPVYLKGYVRSRLNGDILKPDDSMEAKIVIRTPDAVLEYPSALNEYGAVSLKFEEKDLPTGRYTANLLVRPNKKSDYTEIARTAFQKESYKIPQFEVRLHAEKRVPIDRPFSVQLTADYYSGGRATERPVTWRVTEYPYAFEPAGMDGFVFSSDARYSRSAGRYQEKNAVIKEDVTSDEGAASITIDPSTDQNNMPRRYIFEATVTGEDEETVTSTIDVAGLPAFVIGLKAERFVKKGLDINPALIALDVNEKPFAGLPLTVRLLKKEWHAHLREGPLGKGKPQTVTDEVKKVLEEKTVMSALNAQSVNFRVPESGVYILQVEARDNLGRLQSVSVDVYVAGEGEITWEKQENKALKAVPDKTTYNPGDKASVLIESPVQNARLLAIVEKPKGYEFFWMDVAQGKAVFEYTVQPDFVPRLPVTFVLMTPRQAQPDDSGVADPGKPGTFAVTKYLIVTPVKNIVRVGLKNPELAMPGKKIEIEITLQDDEGKPIAGEAALWLVDQAVLALGKEGPLDPLPYFIDPVTSRLVFRDFRNQVFGKLNVVENPGGDSEGYERRKSLLDNATVRRNFKTIAYYSPSIIIDKSGKKKITVELPDNVTVFQIRSVACTKFNRFGMAKSSVEVRLPVVVQTALPRFVRYGDKLKAGAFGRVVLGEGGKGTARIELSGAQLEGKDSIDFTWDKVKATRMVFPMQIKSPEIGQEGKISAESLSVKVSAARMTDEASDAFEVKIPILPDRSIMTIEAWTNLDKNSAVAFPQPLSKPIPGTLKQRLLFTANQALLKAIGGQDYLLTYPYECLEQKISRAYSAVAFKELYRELGIEEIAPNVDQLVNNALAMIKDCRMPDGLYAYWPKSGSGGYVILTAYVLEFLSAAKAVGYSVNDSELESAVTVLKQALRSDYSRFITGYHFTERTEALYALSVSGYFDSSYASRLADEARYAGVESRSRILYTLLKMNYYDQKTIKELKKGLWNNLTFIRKDGKEIFAGLQAGIYEETGGLIHSYEIKTIADIFRALSYHEGIQGKLKLILDQIIQSGGADGWGNTTVNSSVLRMLADYLKNSNTDMPNYSLEVQTSSAKDRLSISRSKYGAVWNGSDPQASVVLQSDVKENQKPFALFRVNYLPDAPGYMTAPLSKGFVVDREIITLDKDGKIKERKWLKNLNETVKVSAGDIIEEHIQIINPENRNFVAIVCPIAAGWEMMNPNLLTSSSESWPFGVNTAKASSEQILDDRASFFYDYLPKGTYDFYFRVRAMTEGVFTEPPALAEMMYKQSVRGNSAGLKVVVEP